MRYSQLMRDATRFQWPTCQADYNVVRVEAWGPLAERTAAYRWWKLRFVAICICATLSFSGPRSAVAAETKRVLILHSFGLDFKPWGEYSRTIRSELARQSPWPLDIKDQLLATARSSDENPEPPFIDYLNALEVKHLPDLIICIGAPAANFIQRNRDRLFPATPMILTAVEQRRVRYDSLTKNDTVVPVAHNYRAVFDNILRLLPHTKQVVVINGASPNEKFWRGELSWELKPYESRLKLLYFDDMPFEAILKEASRLPSDTAIFWHLMNVDAAGVAYEGDTGLKKLFAVANAPIFSYDDGFFGQEIVGGPMYSVLESSEKTVAIAVRILSGERAGDIKTPPVLFATPKYDWRLLQRWGISERLLLPGSQIYFRDPSAWEKYRWQVTLVCALILLQCALISGLLYQRRRRFHAEVQSRQRMAELAHVNRFSTAGELSASIAHEINQPLGAIMTNAETAQEILKSQGPDIAELPDIVELKDIVKDILQDDRRASEVIRRMRSLLKKAPFELKNIDLNDIARETVEFLSALAIARKVELVSVIIPDVLPILGDHIQLQQVILNFVVNGIDAMKDTPSENRIISIRTSRVENFAQLSVSDRGPGIPEDKLKEVFEPFFTSKAGGMGMGLSIARTIIEAHEGLIWAKNRDHGGASLRIRLPLVR
jgi:signal transduction histidine kinase